MRSCVGWKQSEELLEEHNNLAARVECASTVEDRLKLPFSEGGWHIVDMAHHRSWKVTIFLHTDFFKGNPGSVVASPIWWECFWVHPEAAKCFAWVDDLLQLHVAEPLVGSGALIVE